MINFRFHVMSLVAVFLALGIGVIVGSAVIDSAVVDQLRSQQARLKGQVDRVDGENGALRADLGALRDLDAKLAREGGLRLLDGALRDVPVLVVAAQGTPRGTVNDLVAQLATAGAASRGTLWLTERFALDDASEVEDLAALVGLPASSESEVVRAAGLAGLGAALRTRTVEATDDPTVAATLLDGLRARGFVEVDAPDGERDNVVTVPPPGTRIVLVSGPAAAVADGALALPLAKALVEARADRVPGRVVAAALSAPKDAKDDAGLVQGIRRDSDVSRRLSTVDDLDDFAGRLATVLALVDLGEPRTGHFGRAAGAQRLIPAPTPS